MRRIVWFDPAGNDSRSMVDWRVAAALAATLFLNFFFVAVIAHRVLLFCPPAIYAPAAGCISIFIAAVFFIAPAVSVQTAGKPLFGVIEDSLGSIPARAARLCGGIFLVGWMAVVVYCSTATWPNNLTMHLTEIQRTGVATAIMLFLFVTGSQSWATLGKLAKFTNGLGIGLLIAAFLRVHDGWPAVVRDVSCRNPTLIALWGATTDASAYAAPLGLLCASIGYRMAGRRELATAGLTGVALPVFVGLLLTAVIGTATFASWLYQPTLDPTVAMALWSKAAMSAVGPRMLIAAVSVFGAVRLGSRLLSDAIIPDGTQTWQKWLVMTIPAAAIGWLSLHVFDGTFQMALDWSGRCLAVTGAVVTGDWITGARRGGEGRSIEWIGVCAVLGGLAVPWWMPAGWVEPWSMWLSAWLLPSFIGSFTICAGLRLVKRCKDSRGAHRVGSCF